MTKARQQFWKICRFLLKCVIFISFNAKFALSSDVPIAKAPSATYLGYFSKTSSGITYSSFSGIRYAKPQGPHNRFKISEMVDDSNKTLFAQKEGYACLQWDLMHFSNYILGQEDCLFMNIYTPNVTGKLSVMVTIPSGFFQFGSSSRYINGPDYFMETKAVVVVTFNYRLGPFGFSNFESDQYPSNLGLKDQVVALRWIKRNIASFGGNPDSITLQGTSSGAASAHLHMMSPMSKGLFHAGISESGNALSVWSTISKYRSRSRLLSLGESAGCKIPPNFYGNADELARCFLNLTGYQIMKAYSSLNIKESYLLFLPVVEDGNPEGGMFLPFDPYMAPEAEVPWLLGLNSDETGFFGFLKMQHKDLANVESVFFVLTYLPLFLYYEDTCTDPNAVTLSLLKRFMNFSSPLNEHFSEFFTNTWKFLLFWYPHYLAMKKHKGVKYGYYFSHAETTLDGVKLHEGVWHSEEYFFLFTKQGRNIRTENSKVDGEMSKLMVNLWVNFILYHNPTPEGWSPKWPEWNEQNKTFYSLGQDNNITLYEDNYLDQYKYFDSLPFRNKMAIYNPNPGPL